ncbi:polyketide synthase [Trichoderma afarasin]
MAVAVIGMGARLPGDASTPEGFWDMLVAARSAQSDVPKSRFDSNAFYHPHPGRTSAISARKAHFLTEDPLTFDAPFFSIKPKEAKEMDPQQRNLLEVSYQALENAGLPIDSIKGSKTCCYVGAFGGDYRDLLIRDNDDLGQYAVSGLWCALAANRVSWFFDLKGPSMTLDSACSSSLIALHLACQSILRGESKMGIAAGSNLLLGPDTAMFLSAGGMLSPDSKSQAFDHKANGYARGEGFGALILKNLDDAIRDGDPIRAIIRGTACNHDGRTPAVGHPSSTGQAALIRAAYEAAGLSPLETGYFEAHGTGTSVGDALETNAINQVFGPGRASDLFIGSVKTNIGHTEGTAGIAGVMKAILIVERGLIPPNIWFEKLSPRINLPPTIKVAAELTPWANSGPRIASINSFGIGGANAHCIVQDTSSYLQGRRGPEATTDRSPVNGVNGSAKADSSRPILIAVSAQDKQGTGRIAQQLETYLDNKQQKDKGTTLLQNLAFTLAKKRSVLPWKAYGLGSDVEAIRKSLAGIKAPVRSSRAPRLGFVFTGQGAQWYAMGRELFAYPEFRDSITSCDSTLKSLGCSWSLLEELQRNEADSRLDTTEMSQAVCTALQIGLVDLFRAWGIQPAAVVGHSSGEIAAAYAAGGLSHRAATAMAYYRGISASSIELNPNLSGGMAAVRAGGDKITPILRELKNGVAIVACYNSPSNCTVSGDKAALEELQPILESADIGFTRLNVRVAYHSPHMSSAAAAYLTDMTTFSAEKDSSHHLDAVPFFSSVRGELIDLSVLGPQYWAENLKSPVNFTGALSALLHHSGGDSGAEHGLFVDGIVEIGPHSALRSYCLEICRSGDNPATIPYVGSLRRGHSAYDTMLSAAGDLWCLGSPVNLSVINGTTSDATILVDLPPYPFNHSISYSAETTASREFRSKGYPHTGLLGAPVLGSMIPQWRKFLRIRDDPWMLDHKVQSGTLYPGAGYVAMVIEAMSQLADPGSEVAGFELQDIVFDAPLQIPDDDDQGIETVTQIGSAKESIGSSWSSFTVASRGGRNEFSFQTHCKGKIRLHYKPPAGSEMAQEIELERQRYLDAYKDAEKQCLRPVPDFYEKAAQVGMGFGPIFQNLQNIHRGSDRSRATIVIPDTKSVMPGQFEHPHIIHPATLDALAQTALNTLSDNGEGLATSVVAAGLESLYIDAQIAKSPGHVFKASATRDVQSNHGAKFTIAVLDSETNAPSLVAKGVEIAYLGKSESTSESPNDGLCWQTVWEADVDLLAPAGAREIIASRVPPEPLKGEWSDSLELITFAHVRKTLAWLSGEGKDFVPKSGTLKYYYEWMLDVVERRKDLITHPFVNEAEPFAEANKTNGPGAVVLEMVSRIGVHQHGIFQNTTQPLEVMLEGKLLHEFYNAIGTTYNTAVSEYMGLLAHKIAGQATVLEVGAGTGGTTARILDRLRNTDGSSMVGRYVFTDVSAGFLGNAATRFSQDASVMEFKTLDIEQNPLDQGFEPDSFDIIVASGVLHATKSIATTLNHCRSLLKPGGRLVLAEPTENTLYVSFIMGTLPGWWLGEDDGRKGGPLLSTPRWDDALRRTGFSGVDVEFQSPPAPMSLLVSTKLGGQPNTVKLRASLDLLLKGNAPLRIIVNSPPAPDSPALALQNLLSLSVQDVSVVTWESLSTSDIANEYFLSLLELDKPFIRDIQEKDFKKLKELLYGSAAVCWMTSGASIDSPNPELSLMTGLARTLINESDVNIMLVDLDKNNGVIEQESLSFVNTIVLSHMAGNMKEREITIRNRIPQIPRLLRHGDFEDALRRHKGDAAVQLVPYGQIKEPVKLVVQQTGLLDRMCFEVDKEALLPLPDEWVEIDVKAVGLNPEDLLTALGKLKDSNIFGFECSGQVTRIGSKAVGLQPGDRVWAWAENCLGTSARFPWWTALKMPASMGFENAASLMAVYVTMYYSFFQAGRLQAGESVLIHSAADAIGQVAIILAQHIGAVIYCTVDSDEKKTMLTKSYGIPVDHIFSAQQDAFAKGLMRMTKDKGVDVVLNSLAGESLRLSWQCLGEFGRFLEIGITDIQANNALEMRPFARNRSFIGVNLRDFMRWPVASARATMDGLRDLLDKGIVKPVKTIDVLDIGDAEQAFRHMQRGKSMGKTVLRMSPDSHVQYKLPLPRMPIDPAATYLLAGGMGGVGRVLANWLISVGAKNMAFISRSAATDLDNQKYLEHLRNEQGINARAWDCDASNKDGLKKALSDIQSTMPPIKGTIVASMVLRDSHFERMSLGDWTVAVQSKVHASQNLHELLPKNLDFFVMLSSGGGIMGYRGQANYHVGNVYQDALAHHRRSQGQAALTIDMGPVLGIGWMAGEFVDVSMQNLQLAGSVPSNPAYLGALIAASFQPNAPPHPANITLALPASYPGGEPYYWMNTPRFSALCVPSRSTGPAAVQNGQIDSHPPLKDEIVEADDVRAAGRITTTRLLEWIARLMAMPLEDIDTQKPLTAYGVDSLVAVELRNWLRRETGLELGVLDMIRDVPMAQFCLETAARVRGDSGKE